MNGVRLSLAAEYSRIYVYNLRGNQRSAGELSRKEGGKVFGSGSRNTIAVLIGIRSPAHTGPCEIFYRDIGDYLTRDRKLEIIAGSDLKQIEWQQLTPDDHGDWISHRDVEYGTWPAIGDKAGGVTVFANYSLGLATNRDVWCYNSSRAVLLSNIAKTVQRYNLMVDQIDELRRGGASLPPVDELIERGDPYFHWDRVNKRQVVKGIRIEFRPDRVRVGSYRPFMNQQVYFDDRQQLNNCTYQLPSMFPTQHHDNIGILLTGPASHFEFTALATDFLPNLHLLDTGQYFPRWTYEKAEPDDGTLDLAAGSGEVDEYGYRSIDNITDGILKLYREAIGDQVTKDDIFFYVYGLLHDPGYRETYAADLKKMLPHIPTPETLERFEQLATAGQALSDLHVGYEDVEPYPVDVQLKPGADPADRETWRVTKLKWAKKKDPDTGKSVDDVTKLMYNAKVTISGIPEDAERYMLGSRSALAWIIDRYQVKTDKASGIVNDPNDWCDEHDDPGYIVDLIAKVTTVAVETMKIVDGLAESG